MVESKNINIDLNINLEDREKLGYKSFYQIVVKRILDVIISLPAIIILLPLFLIISIAIKVNDNGPVFYKSGRLGRGFTEFNMYKFRSMKVNAPNILNKDGSTYNSEDDPRVTKVGRFLRETSLDELPQLINVLIGNMTLIGPRAGDVESKDTYEDDEKDKMLVKPGITGLTQAYYRNGLGVREKRLYDAWYAHNVTFLLDIKIIFRTVKTVLCRENLYTNSSVVTTSVGDEQQ